MPVVIVSGIVTRYVNYRENDRIISIITPDRGRVDAKARGARRQNSPLLPCAETFVYGEFELFLHKDKYTVNGCGVTESFFPIREDIVRFALGTSMLQLVSDTVQENEPNEAMFLLLYRALSFLAYGEADATDLFLCFLIRFLNAAGLKPSITACAQCGRDVRGDEKLFFSPLLGGAVCAACARGGAPVSKTALEALRRMLLLTEEQMDRVRLSEQLRGELYALLTDYAEQALEYGPRALAFMRQIR